MSWGKSLLVLEANCCLDVNEVLHYQIVTISGGKVHGSVAHVVGHFIRVLTLSDHDTNHVEIAFFGGFPDVCKKLNLKDTYG